MYTVCVFIYGRSVIFLQGVVNQTAKLAPPRLIVENNTCIVVADEVVVATDTADTFDAIVNLFAAYFAWGLDYRRVYQVLHFLHMYVLGEQTNVRKTSNFVKLEKTLFTKHIHVQKV